MKLIFYGSLIVVIFLSSCIRVVEKEPEVKGIKIGKQVWASSNLNVDKFRNGDVILKVTTADEWLLAESKGQPAWGYYQNDSAKYAKFGKLYNWYAVHDPRGLAPEGYHIPKNEEWDVLISHLGISEAGKKMKSTTEWKDNGNGTNVSRFNGFPGGNVGNANFYGVGFYGYWWSATEDNTEFAWCFDLSSVNHILEQGRAYKGNGMSVRCIKD